MVGSRFGSISNGTMKTKFLVIVTDAMRPTKVKAAVRSPEPTEYSMMRSMIEFVLLKRISDLRRWKRTMSVTASAVSENVVMAVDAQRL